MASNHQPKCLCELCSCSPKVHVCVLKEPKIPFDHESTYKKDYPVKVAEPVEFVESDLPSEDEEKIPKFQAESTYHADFPAKQIPTASVEQEEIDRKADEVNSVPFEAVSTYQSQFKEKQIPKEEILEEEEEREDQSDHPRFEAVSTYQNQFQQKPFPKEEDDDPFSATVIDGKLSSQLEYIRRQMNNENEDEEDDVSNRLRFEAVSTYQSQYQEKPIPKPEMEPFSATYFDGKCQSQLEYVRRQLSNAQCPSCSIFEQDDLVKPGEDHQYFVKEDGKWKAYQS